MTLRTLAIDIVATAVVAAWVLATALLWPENWRIEEDEDAWPGRVRT